MLPEPIAARLHRQYGIVADFQLSGSLSPSDRRRLIRRGEIERLSPRVWRHVGSHTCDEQKLMAAVLDCGPTAALWGKSAASFWGFGHLTSRLPHVAVRRTGVRRPRLGEVHELSRLDDRAITTYREVPIGRPEEIVLWLAGMWTHRCGQNGLEFAVDRTARTLDLAWRMGLIDGQRIHELCDRSGGHGRSGIVVLRQVLEDRPPGYRPSGSALEERFESILPADLRGRLERQVTVGGVDGPIGTVDYRHRERPLIVEVNGAAFHTTLSDREADETRYAGLVSAGFAVMVVWERDVFYRPRLIVDALRAFENAPFEARLLRPTRPPWETW